MDLIEDCLQPTLTLGNLWSSLTQRIEPGQIISPVWGRSVYDKWVRVRLQCGEACEEAYELLFEFCSCSRSGGRSEKNVWEWPALPSQTQDGAQMHLVQRWAGS